MQQIWVIISACCVVYVGFRSEWRLCEPYSSNDSSQARVSADFGQKSSAYWCFKGKTLKRQTKKMCQNTKPTKCVCGLYAGAAGAWGECRFSDSRVSQYTRWICPALRRI